MAQQLIGPSKSLPTEEKSLVVETNTPIPTILSLTMCQHSFKPQSLPFTRSQSLRTCTNITPKAENNYSHIQHSFTHTHIPTSFTTWQIRPFILSQSHLHSGIYSGQFLKLFKILCTKLLNIQTNTWSLNLHTQFYLAWKSSKPKLIWQQWLTTGNLTFTHSHSYSRIHTVKDWFNHTRHTFR